MNMKSLRKLSDRELIEGLKALARNEREATAALVAHLVEVDRRDLYREEGYSSLFAYCTQVLHFSENAAYNRIEAARAVARCPVVLEWLERGDVHLTAVKLLASLLTPENCNEILAAAKHKTRREIEELVARLRPRPDVPDRIQKTRATDKAARAIGSHPNRAMEPIEDRGAVSGGVAADGATTLAPDGGAASGMAAPDEATTNPTPALLPERQPAPEAPGVVVALAPERYKIQFTASAATHDKLRRAQELMRHRLPNGDLGQIFDRALDLLVRDLEKKMLGATDRPRRAPAARAQAGAASASRRRSRHIPAAVKRAVWKRDQGRCAFVSSSGVRCNERARLQFDHVWPHGDGGPATVDNVRLLCRSHNQHEAQRFFGVWQLDGSNEHGRDSSRDESRDDATRSVAAPKQRGG